MLDIKKVFGLFFALCLVIGLVPVTAYAAGYGDKGYDTTNDGSYKIDGNDVLTYVTGIGGTITRISGGDDDSIQQYKATAFDNWEFAYWSTYYNGPSTKDDNPVAALGYWYFSKPDDADSRYDKTHPVIQINEEVWAGGVYYLQAIFKPKITVSVNRELEASATSIRGDSPATYLDSVFISSSSGYVPFGGAVEITLTAFKEDYIVQSVTVNDGVSRDDFTYEVDTEHNELKVFFTATRPTNVSINVKIKEQKVAFDSNGGSGIMTSQVFESSKAQMLSENTFSKTGYIFDGWNTEADGKGTFYSDKQLVSFTPANDGDSITLYAQWSKCNDHQYENSICTKCGLECLHDSCNYSLNGSVLTETCSAECGHQAIAELEVMDTCIYTGSAITPATITYSDNWQGSRLDEITYSNNINVGTATARITVEGKELIGKFTISPASLDNAQITLEYDNIPYDGKTHKPSCSVTLEGFGVLTDGIDYKAVYLAAMKIEDGVPVKWFGDGTTNADCITPGIYGVVILGVEGGNFAPSKPLGVFESYTIGKAIPEADDFTFTPPISLNYDGSVKNATIEPASGITGMGDITITY